MGMLINRHRDRHQPDEQAEGDLDSLTMAELKEYAEEHDVDLGDATKKADIRAAIDDPDDKGE